MSYAEEVQYWERRVSHLSQTLNGLRGQPSYGYYAGLHQEALKNLTLSREDMWYDQIIAEAHLGRIDLHGVSTKFVQKYLSDLLDEQTQNQIKIITGRGSGALKKQVRQFLSISGYSHQEDHRTHSFFVDFGGDELY